MRSARVVCLVVLSACAADNTIAPRTVASIAVTSSIGTRLAVGRSTQLTAEPRDASGAAIDNAPVTWSSSSSAVQVSAAGLVSGVAAGNATITAEAAGVTESFTLQVIAADLDGIVATVDDDFAKSVVANLTVAVRTQVQGALTQCASGAAQGNFTTIESCLTSARTQVTSATDPTDQALLASLALYLDRIQILLNL